VRETLRAFADVGQLTPSLVLRALLSGNRDLFEPRWSSFRLREDRVAGQLRDFRGAGFAALYAKRGCLRSSYPRSGGA